MRSAPSAQSSGSIARSFTSLSGREERASPRGLRDREAAVHGEDGAGYAGGGLGGEEAAGGGGERRALHGADGGRGRDEDHPPWRLSLDERGGRALHGPERLPEAGDHRLPVRLRELQEGGDPRLPRPRDDRVHGRPLA